MHILYSGSSGLSNLAELLESFLFSFYFASFNSFFYRRPHQGFCSLDRFRFFQDSTLGTCKSLYNSGSCILFRERSAKEINNVLLSLLLILPPFILVLIQPDIGSSLTFLAIWFGIVLISGFKTKHIILLILISVIFIASFYEVLAPYQKQRITTFISPQRDPLGTGYNIIQSKIAIGSGNLLGKGFGKGSQSQLQFLPEAESDFMFASISEQLGLIGSGFLVIIFTWLISRIITITRDKKRYEQLLIIGISALLIAQFTINVGMNLALLPVTGIPFPLVSYGGSSLITTLFLLGLVFAINRSRS